MTAPPFDESTGRPSGEGAASPDHPASARGQGGGAAAPTDDWLRLVFRVTNDAFWEWDAATGAFTWHEGQQSAFVGPDGEGTPRTLDEWVARLHPGDRGRVRGWRKAFLEGRGERWQVEYRVQRVDGAYAVVQERGVAERDAAGRVLRLVGAVHDATEARQADELRTALYEEGRRARVEAERANHAKSQFLATMSHEIRTPINAIMGYADLLDAGLEGELSPGQRRYLGKLRQSSHHLLGLVNDVLDLAKVEAGEMKVRTARVTAAGALGDAVALVTPQAAAKGVALGAEGECPADVCYLGDEDRVRQILVNLLSNAVKFTEGGGHVDVRCRVCPDAPKGAQVEGPGPWMVFEVEDNGMGVPPEDMERIFDPFAQVEGGHTRRKGGTGLGLTISRRFARLMKGDLTVRSELGHGSCFILTLPTAEAAEAVPAPASASDGWPSGPGEVPGLTVLGRVVADNADALTRLLGDRLCADAGVPGARGLNRAQLENHIATFLLDLGKTLVTLDEGGGEPALMQDSHTIQHLISQRHGQQRRRIGWTADEVRREYAFLRQELHAIVGRKGEEFRDSDPAAALRMLDRLLERSEQIAIAAFEENAASKDSRGSS